MSDRLSDYVGRDLRRHAINAVLLITIIVAVFMVYMAYLTHDEGSDIGAAGWLVSGFLLIRDALSKIENLTLLLRRTDPAKPPDVN